jgi:hypothetical protein
MGENIMEKVAEKVIEKDSIALKRVKENILAAGLMFFIVPLNIFYIMLNTSKRGVHDLVTPIDNMIPFMKVFIIPYVAWYAFIFIIVVYLFFKDREVYYTTVISYNFGLIAAYITFFFFQTTVPRPEITGSDVLSKMVLSIYGADQPYNCFPSIHVLTSFLMVKALSASKIKNKLNLGVVWLSAVAIIMSTLFVKQHVILDAVSGIVYADVIFRIVNAYSGRVFAWIKKQFLLLMMKKKLEI